MAEKCLKLRTSERQIQVIHEHVQYDQIIEIDSNYVYMYIYDKNYMYMYARTTCTCTTKPVCTCTDKNCSYMYKTCSICTTPCT